MLDFKQFPLNYEKILEHSQRFQGQLNRLEQGSDATLPSWFWETRSPSWLLHVLESRLNDMRDHKGISQWDLSKSDKFAPQGESAPLVKRLDTLNEYYSHLDVPSIIKDPLWPKAKREAIRRLRFRESGAPVTVEQVLARGLRENKYDTSSGYPEFGKRKDPEVLRKTAEQASHAIDDRYPTVLGSRASMGKTGVDARHIFMGSMPVNVWGQRYQQPLQDYIRSLKLDFFSPWEGWDHVQELISTRWTDSNLKFGADYTKMDQHFNKYHGLEVFDVIKHYFKREYWPELHKIITYVFTMPVVTNLGVLESEHAMPSGSEWTNFLETMWNYIFHIFLELKYGLKFEFAAGIGDDQLWMLHGKWTDQSIKWITDVVIDEFNNAGLPGNPLKQEVGVHTTGFLQRHLDDSWFGYDGKTKAAGVYSLIRNATSEKFPEFRLNLKRGDPAWHDLFAIRVIQIAENTVHHPEFLWYIREIVAKSNPHVLEFVRKKDSEILELWNHSRELSHFIPSYVGAKDDSVPLTEFIAFKELRKLA